MWNSGTVKKRILPFLLTLSLILLGLSACAGKQAEQVEGTLEQSSKVEILVFHNNPCEACNEEERLEKLVKEQYPDEAEHYKLQIKYAYHSDGQEALAEIAAYFNTEKSQLLFPLAVVGDTLLSGETQLTEELSQCLSRARQESVTRVMPNKEEAEELFAEPKEEKSFRISAGEDVIHLLYFETEICANCSKAKESLSHIPQSISLGGREYPVVITSLSVAWEDNAMKFAALTASAGIPKKEQQVPLLFVGEKYFSGVEEIKRGVEELSALEVQRDSLAGQALGAVYQAEGIRPEAVNLPLYLLKTAGIGVINGFNPCALSLALLFFSLIAGMEKGFLRYGLTFLGGKLLAYTLLGLAAATAFSAIPFQAFSALNKGMKAVLAAVCVVLALGNLWDSLKARKGEYGKIRMQLPGKLRRLNDRFTKSIAKRGGSPFFAAVVFGGSMVIALGEFFCTGQIYLVYILEQLTKSRTGIPLYGFLLYSVSLCIPALCILLLLKKGKSVLDMSGQSLRNMPWVKLLTALLFLAFAIYVLVGF